MQKDIRYGLIIFWKTSMINMYTLELENDKLLNIISLVRFLKTNEGNCIELIVNQESHCLQHTGVYELLDCFTFKNVDIFTANAVEYHNIYNIKYSYNWYHWFEKIQNFDHTFDYLWNREKIFGCFYGRPAASRLGVASYLSKKYNHLSLIKLAFSIETEDDRIHLDLEKLFSWDAESIKNVDSLLTLHNNYHSTFLAYNYKTFEYDFGNKLNYLYKDIFVDIVIEAHVEGNSFYPTEKIVRSILCKKPFIVIAPPFYLRYLKQMGFKTFSNYWSEAYDDLGAKNRYFAILKLIDQLANTNKLELINMNSSMTEILEHNYQLLVSQKFNKTVQRIVPVYD